MIAKERRSAFSQENIPAAKACAYHDAAAGMLLNQTDRESVWIEKHGSVKDFPG